MSQAGGEYIIVRYEWQPAARGHGAYTDLSAARVRSPVLSTVLTSLQACQLGNDPLLNMVLHPLWTCVEGPPFIKHSGGFLGSASCRCLRSGHNRSHVGRITKIMALSGEFMSLGKWQPGD